MECRSQYVEVELSFCREHVSLLLRRQWELPWYLGDGSDYDPDRRGDFTRARLGGQHDVAHGGDAFSV